MKPFRDFSTDLFENMLEIQCTLDEICHVFSCAPNTLKSWIKREYGDKVKFEDVANRHRAKGKESLRRTLFNLAEKNPAVAIFLAKNYLGMSDDPQPASTGEEKKELDAAIRDGFKALKTCADKLASFPMKEGGNG